MIKNNLGIEIYKVMFDRENWVEESYIYNLFLEIFNKENKLTAETKNLLSHLDKTSKKLNECELPENLLLTYYCIKKDQFVCMFDYEIQNSKVKLINSPVSNEYEHDRFLLLKASKNCISDIRENISQDFKVL